MNHPLSIDGFPFKCGRKQSEKNDSCDVNAVDSSHVFPSELDMNSQFFHLQTDWLKGRSSKKPSTFFPMKDGKKILSFFHQSIQTWLRKVALLRFVISPRFTRSFHQIFGEQTPRPTRSSALNTKVKAGFFGYERGRPHSKLGDVTLGNVPIRDEQAYYRTMEVSFNLYISIL